jgi:uncharacterized protein DUF1573/centrosomal CEP192-like protein/HYDIN/CFA65/VesB family protein
MGCKHKGSGVCFVLRGRRVAVVFLFFAVLGFGAGKSSLQAPPAPSAPDDANTFTFGDQQVGTRSAPQAIHLQNTGITVLVITNIQATANFGETDDCRPSVPVGGHCTVQVTFDPTTTGPLTGTVTVTSNAASPPFVFKLNGRGLLTAPEVSPSNLNFGDQSIGNASAPQTVTFTNTGALALSITSLNVSNGWTQSNNCLPSVPPKGSCTVQVSFRPGASGPVNGALTFSEYTTNSPQSVTLSGTGVGPLVRLSPGNLDFSADAVSTTTTAKSVTLTNSGNGALKNLIVATSGDFAQTNDCGGSLDASASCTINVTFTPKEQGNRKGTLTLNDNAPDSPQNLRLDGSVGAVPVWLITSSLAFSNQAVGTSSAPVTLGLIAPQPLDISSISVTGDNSDDFSLDQNCGNSLAANTACQITLTFTPKAAGARSASVSIADSAANSPQTISLTGTGVSPAAGPTAQR